MNRKDFSLFLVAIGFLIFFYVIFNSDIFQNSFLYQVCIFTMEKSKKIVTLTFCLKDLCRLCISYGVGYLFSTGYYKTKYRIVYTTSIYSSKMDLATFMDVLEDSDIKIIRADVFITNELLPNVIYEHERYIGDDCSIDMKY